MTETSSSGASVLIVPGLGGSGPEHWQSIWQVRNPNYRRVEQQDWDEPDLEGRLSGLEIAVREAPSPRWGAHLIDAGPKGHINTGSGHGEWPEGERYVAEFLEGV